MGAVTKLNDKFIIFVDNVKKGEKEKDAKTQGELKRKSDVIEGEKEKAIRKKIIVDLEVLKSTSKFSPLENYMELEAKDEEEDDEELDDLEGGTDLDDDNYVDDDSGLSREKSKYSKSNKDQSEGSKSSKSESNKSEDPKGSRSEEPKPQFEQSNQWKNSKGNKTWINIIHSH